MTPQDKVLMQLIRFHLKKYQAQVAIPERNLVIGTWENEEMNALAIRLVRYVATIKGENVLRIETPASWWQHFKQTLFAKRWCPAWIKQRWPVRYDVKVYLAEAMFPNLEIPNDRPEFEIGFYNWTLRPDRS